MGDRVSISFKNGSEESVVLFNHWGGRGFPEEAKRYVADLRSWIKKNSEGISKPLTRL